MEIIKKQKILKLLLSTKNDNLNLTKNNIKKKFSFGGKLLVVFWKTRFTKFDINEYVKVSKKQRTNISEKKVKEVLQYSFLGYCYNFKKNYNSINTSFSLRNVLDGFPIEMVFPIYSPVILGVIFAQNKDYKKFSRVKLFFLRFKTIPESFVEFLYVSTTKLEQIKTKFKSIKKLKK